MIVKFAIHHRIFGPTHKTSLFRFSLKFFCRLL
jgi:hypothetical protein